jgi:hypothetical protein
MPGLCELQKADRGAHVLPSHARRPTQELKIWCGNHSCSSPAATSAYTKLAAKDRGAQRDSTIPAATREISACAHIWEYDKPRS